MKKQMIMGLLLGATLLLSGCTDENGNDKRSLSLLMKANENFSQVTSYMETTYQTKTIQEKYTQTDVAFRELQSDKKGSYASGKRDEFVISYPTAVKNKGDLQFQTPTKVVNREKDDKGNYFTMEYMSLYKQGEYLPFAQKPYKGKDVALKKEDVASLLNLAVKLPPEKAEAEGINLYAYTGADYQLKTFPQHLKNLKKKEEKEVNGKTYIILTADVDGKKEEMFFLYDKAKAEYWIDKETKRVVKEVYRSSDYNEKTGSGMTVYQYNDFDKDFKLKESKDLNGVIKQYIDSVDLEEKATSEVKINIDGEPLKKGGDKKK